MDLRAAPGPSARRPSVRRRTALDGHWTRNRWEAIALEALDLVSGHPPLATRSRFGGDDAVFAEAADLGRTDAKLPRDLTG